MAYITLGGGNSHLQTIVDDDLFNVLSLQKWCLGKKGYVRAGTAMLHHAVIGKPPEGMVVDHVNRNKLDNRSSNLRFATVSENALNWERPPFRIRLDKGVLYKKDHKKWYAFVDHQKKRHHVGYYDTELVAYEKRAEYVHSHFPLANII